MRVWKTYENGALVRISRITKPSGKQPDTFELYEENQLAAIGYDRDGDGKPDVWEKVGLEDKKRPEAPSATPVDGGAPAAAGPASPDSTTPAKPATTPITADGGTQPTTAIPANPAAAAPLTTPAAGPATPTSLPPPK